MTETAAAEAPAAVKPLQPKMTLACPTDLSEAELVMRSRELVKIDDDLTTLDQEKTDFLDDWKDRRRKLETRQVELKSVVRSGKEDRPITCVRQPDYVRGVWEWIRTDNGKAAKTEPMSRQDQQLSIPGAGAVVSQLPAKQPPQIVTEAVDIDGEIVQITAEQADQVRIALSSDEKHCDLEIGGQKRRIVALKACAECGAADGNHRPDGHAELADEPAPETAEAPATTGEAAPGRLYIGVDRQGDEHPLSRAEAIAALEWLRGEGPHAERDFYPLERETMLVELESVMGDVDELEEELAAEATGTTDDAEGEDDGAKVIAALGDDALEPPAETKPKRGGRKGKR